MLQQEFTARTGYTPLNEEEWKAIETMYMEAGDSVDKDLFCKEWLQHKDSQLLRIFYRRALDQRESKEYFDNLRTTLAYRLIAKAVEHDDEELSESAAKLIGRKRVVLRKVSEGYELDESDKEYITDYLQ